MLLVPGHFFFRSGEAIAQNDHDHGRAGAHDDNGGGVCGANA